MNGTCAFLRLPQVGDKVKVIMSELHTETHTARLHRLVSVSYSAPLPPREGQ